MLCNRVQLCLHHTEYESDLHVVSYHVYNHHHYHNHYHNHYLNSVLLFSGSHWRILSWYQIIQAVRHLEECWMMSFPHSLLIFCPRVWAANMVTTAILITLLTLLTAAKLGHHSQTMHWTLLSFSHYTSQHQWWGVAWEACHDEIFLAWGLDTTLTSECLTYYVSHPPTCLCSRPPVTSLPHPADMLCMCAPTVCCGVPLQCES